MSRGKRKRGGRSKRWDGLRDGMSSPAVMRAAPPEAKHGAADLLEARAQARQRSADLGIRLHVVRTDVGYEVADDLAPDQKSLACFVAGQPFAG